MIASNTPTFFDYIRPYKSRGNIDLKCPRCKSTFIRTKNVIQSKLGPHNNEEKIFCSRACSNTAKTTSQIVNCLQCNKSFAKKLNQVTKSPNHFCSRVCAGKYNAAHKTKGNRRSKLEIWLENQLNKLFPSLAIIYNQRDAINAELDIYVPSLKIAFELNGIFHYEPIYGQDKLASIKTNDSRRFQACLEKNIELVIIDTSKEKYFKEITSKKYLDIIEKLIAIKLSE